MLDKTTTADAGERAFWRWAAKVQEEVRRSARSPTFEIESFCDFAMVEQMYFDELEPYRAARAIISEHRWD